MTLREAIESELVNHGLWPKQAHIVVNEYKVETSGAMKGRWDEDKTAYPPKLFDALLMGAKQQAIAWIDANKPKHFARRALEPEVNL